MDWLKNNSKDEFVKEKEDCFEIIRIKERLFNFELDKIKVPKSQIHLLKNNRKLIENE